MTIQSSRSLRPRSPLSASWAFSVPYCFSSSPVIAFLHDLPHTAEPSSLKKLTIVAPKYRRGRILRARCSQWPCRRVFLRQLILASRAHAQSPPANRASFDSPPRKSDEWSSCSSLVSRIASGQALRRELRSLCCRMAEGSKLTDAHHMRPRTGGIPKEFFPHSIMYRPCDHAGSEPDSAA